MKSILVAVSGTGSDNAVLDAAYAIAAPLNAHLDFVHIPLAAIEAVDFNHHIEFARGSGLEAALKDVLPRSKDAETKALSHVTDFCSSKNISSGISARLNRPSDGELDRVPDHSWRRQAHAGSSHT